MVMHIPFLIILAAFTLQQENWVVETKTIWPAKRNQFYYLPFTEKITKCYSKGKAPWITSDLSFIWIDATMARGFVLSSEASFMPVSLDMGLNLSVHEMLALAIRLIQVENYFDLNYLENRDHCVFSNC